MSIAIIILAVITLAVLLVLGLAARRPDTFTLRRQRTIAATPETIAAHVNDFHKWQAWSPWETIDPTMQRSFSGAAAGIGAGYAWTGTGKAGEGRMTITAVTPAATGIVLEFVRPFPAKNEVEFSYAPQADGTLVTWTMSGRTPFIGKIMHSLFDMDKMVGKDFETGLSNLKALSENPGPTALT